jgi:hypothetical protein
VVDARWSPHRDVTAYLNRQYNCWIGRNGPIAWPARSPDLNPLDYYLWGHVKSVVSPRVYRTERANANDLWNRIREVADEIRHNRLVFENAKASFLRRVRLCLAQNGKQFEHLL